MKAIINYLKSDPEFAQALIGSFIKNLTSFRIKFQQAMNSKEDKQFMEAYLKIKTTLGFTGNEKLAEQCDLIVEILQQEGIHAVDVRLQNYVCRLCTAAIDDLENQLLQYTASYENISV